MPDLSDKINIDRVILSCLAGSVAFFFCMGMRLFKRVILFSLLRGWKSLQSVKCIATWYQNRFSPKISTKSSDSPNCTLSSLVDKVAIEFPDKIFAIIPSHDADHVPGWRWVTFKSLAYAVTFTCCWIEKTIGPSQGPEYIAYVGGNDIQYAILILACMKTGYIVSAATPPVEPIVYH